MAILGLAAFGVYKFYPQAFDNAKDEYYKLTGKTDDSPAVIRHEAKPVKKDTAKKTVAPTDTASKAVTTVAKPDSLKAPHWEAITDEFIHLQAAKARVAYLKRQGYDAYIAVDAPGPAWIKVSVGQLPHLCRGGLCDQFTRQGT